MALRHIVQLVLLSALLKGSVAYAEPRPIPADSKLGYLRHVESMAVTVDGEPMQLAVGATIRDQQNLILVPMSLPREGAWARFTVDRQGRIFRVWLLTPEELRQGTEAPTGG